MMSGYEDIVPTSYWHQHRTLVVMYQDLDPQSSGFPDIYTLAK
jgi:hypothetical protein